MTQLPFVALCAQEHNQISYTQDENYNFARRTLAVPINLTELPFIIRHYPVLFRKGKTTYPVAILSLDGRDNSFLDANGRWRPHHYIPAAIKLHPFVLHEIPEHDTGILLFDQTSSRISASHDNNETGRLFKNNREPTALLRTLVAGQAQFHASKRKAMEFGSLLFDEHLLTASNISLSTHENASPAKSALYGINEHAYRQLPAHIVDQWFRESWIDAICLILASQNLWAKQLLTKPETHGGMRPAHV